MREIENVLSGLFLCGGDFGAVAHHDVRNAGGQAGRFGKVGLVLGGDASGAHALADALADAFDLCVEALLFCTRRMRVV